MKKLIILISVLFFQNTIAQEIYLNLGRNYTGYDYENSDGDTNKNIENGNGTYFEVGYSNLINNTNFSYELGVNFNQYNAIGGDSANAYSWNTDYLGIQGLVSYAFINTNAFEVSIGAGLNLNTIISGEQEINGAFYNLVDEKEFSGLIIHPKANLQAKYIFDRFGSLSIGYNFSKSFHPFNSTDEKLSFNNNQIYFGIHFFL